MNDWRGVPLEVGQEALYTAILGDCLRRAMVTVEKLTEHRVYVKAHPKYAKENTWWFRDGEVKMVSPGSLFVVRPT